MKYVLLLVVATVISAQLLMFSSRDVPLATRLRDMSEGGEVATIGGAAFLMCGSIGALVGDRFNAPGDGAAAGLAIAVIGIAIAVIWAHRRP